MTDLKAYFAAPRTAARPSAAEIGALVAACPWFIPGRILLGIVTGEEDPLTVLTAPWRAESSLRMPDVDASALDRLSSDEIIDRFLKEENLRIVAQEGEPERRCRSVPNWRMTTRWFPRSWPKSISPRAFGTGPWRFIAN